MRIDLNANECVIKAGDGKHYAGAGKIDGKLVLTNQRIYFVTLNGNGCKNLLEILPEQIREVMNFSNRFFFSNGLCILLKDGHELKFELKDNKSWIEKLARIIN